MSSIKKMKASSALKKNKNTSAFNLQFWLLCISSFLFFSSFNMIIPELPSYLTSLGGAAYKGFIISLFTLTAALSRPFSGKLADTIGRIPIMIIGAGVCFVIGFVYPMVTTVAGFLLLRLLHGFSTGFKPTGTSAYVADVVPMNRRGEAMGILGVFGSLGIAAGPAVGGLVAQLYSTDIMFYASSASAILSVIILMGMKETLPDKQRFQWHQLYITRGDIFEPLVKAPSIIMFLSAYSFGVVLTIIPDFSDYLGVTNRGYFFASFTAASILVRIFAGKISDKYGRTTVLRYSTLMVMVAMILVGTAQTPFMFLMYAALLGIAAGMNSPTIFAWTIDLSNPLRRAKAMATMYIAMEIGIGLGALITGFLVNNRVDRIPYTFYIGAFLSGVAFLYLEFYYLPLQTKLKDNEN